MRRELPTVLVVLPMVWAAVRALAVPAPVELQVLALVREPVHRQVPVAVLPLAAVYPTRSNRPAGGFLCQPVNPLKFLG